MILDKPEVNSKEWREQMEQPKQTTILDEAIKEASISIACCLDEVSEVTQHDLEHIQKQIDIIETEIFQK